MSGILGQGQLGDFLLGNGEEESGITTYNAFAQAQALILRTEGAYGQAQAQIRGTYNRHGQAQALIDQYFRFAQAQAIILPRYGFLAIVRSGTGGPNYFNGSYYGSYWEKDPNMPNYNDFGPFPPVYPGLENWGIKWDTQYWSADVSGSWKFATSSDDGSSLYVYDESNNFVGGVNNNVGGGQGNTYASANVTLTAGTRYRLEMVWGQGGTAFNVAGYYRRPGDTSDSYLTNGSPPWMIPVYFGWGQAQAEIITGYRFGYGQSQADILQTYRGYGQSQADILQTYNGFGQAQATITGNAHGQAQANILQVYNAFSQAQAGIKQTYNGFSQAQGTIGQFYHGFGQAQAQVLKTYNGFGQAQGTILQVYSVFAQAQADILQTYNAYGQAQASIGQVGRGYGQAQARILQVYVGVGQAQGSILQVYTGLGQAQADILQTYTTYAQAQALIVITNQGYGQAQGTILQIYSVFAQAQADILQTYQGYGQAQGLIGVPSNAYAQAQARIKQVYRGYAQAQSTIVKATQGYGQAEAFINSYRASGNAQAYIFQDKVYAQSQGRILIKGFSPAQAQAYIRSGYFGLAQALIDSQIKNQTGQAQAWICSLDTFTRTTSFGLGTGYTWTNYDSAFGAASESTYEVDGSKVINSPDDFEWDSYIIDAGLPLAATVSFDFTTNSTLIDFPYLALLFGQDYEEGRHNIAIYSDGPGENWYLNTNWSTNNGTEEYGFTAATNATYRVKMNYNNDGYYQAKIWNLSGAEPGWLITGQIPDFAPTTNAWLDFYFGQDIVSFDNLHVCIPEPITITVNSYAQAAALINRSEGYGQAQGTITNNKANGAAQAYIAWTSVQSPFTDTFTRTTNRGLGAPHYLWNNLASSVDHPAATTIYVDGNKVVIPSGKSDSYYLGYTFKMFNRLDFETVITTLEPFTISLTVPGSPEREFRFFYTGSGNLQLNVYLNGVLNSGSGFTADVGTFKVTIIFNPVFAQFFFYKNGVFTGSSSGSSTGNYLGNTNLLIKFIGGATGGIAFDNLFLDSGRPQHGQARARIKLAGINRHGQARARIKQTFQGYAQVQAIINQVLQTGQAQAFIGDQLRVGWGQAQAWIRMTRRGHGQARAWIKVKRWTWGQAQAYILKGVGYGQAQAFIAGKTVQHGQARAYILGKLVGYAQAQGFIKRTISHGMAQAYILRDEAGYLVKYNNYLLPGYLQGEALVSDMSKFSWDAEFYATRTEPTGLENKVIEAQFLIVEDTYANAKIKVHIAGTMLRSSRREYTRLFLKNPDRYYLALTRGIRTEQTAGINEKHLTYDVTWEAKPWLYGSSHVLTGPIDTNDVGRTFENGTWTPAIVTLTGTNPTVSGYTDAGEFTGYISVSGNVTNLVIDTENYSATMNGYNVDHLVNMEYQIYIGPGRTRFDTTGITNITVEYEDRWPL